MNILVSYMLNRLKEPSTVKGTLSLIAGAVGFTLTGAQLTAAAAVISTVYAALSVVMPDKFGGAATPVAPALTPVAPVAVADVVKNALSG